MALRACSQPLAHDADVPLVELHRQPRRAQPFHAGARLLKIRHQTLNQPRTTRKP
jgi:hypothetical protein